MSTAPPSKKARTSPAYTLLYHPTIPGRGEPIRLLFAATKTPYSDIANEQKDGYDAVLASVAPDSIHAIPNNPPAFAPPCLQIAGAGRDGNDLLIHQTPTILEYLARELKFGPGDEAGKAWVSQIALTALDFANETHDGHHPIAASLYYEDQKEEALRKAKGFREGRIPKFLSYFERALKANEAAGKGKYFVDGGLSYADTTVWNVVDGLLFAFPKEMEARKKDYPLVFETFYPSIKNEEGIKEYLESGKRLPYGNGIYRKYPELDRP